MQWAALHFMFIYKLMMRVNWSRNRMRPLTVWTPLSFNLFVEKLTHVRGTNASGWAQARWHVSTRFQYPSVAETDWLRRFFITLLTDSNWICSSIMCRRWRAKETKGESRRVRYFNRRRVVWIVLSFIIHLSPKNQQPLFMTIEWKIKAFSFRPNLNGFSFHSVASMKLHLN